MELTKQQAEAVSAKGKVIVSASAGSGKTFVMIEKLVNAIADGADIGDVLAVTFTKKAAAQMKEKLRKALIKRMETPGADKRWLKTQLSEISAANISTIHSFCAKLLRTYFYVLGIDAGFDIISADDARASEMKAEAADALFERLYAENDEDFKHLLKCFMKKRSDASLKKLLWEAYSEVRSCARYGKILEDAESFYCEEGFDKICGEYRKLNAPKFAALLSSVEKYESEFKIDGKAETYAAIFSEMKSALKTGAEADLFAGKPPFTVTRKPADAAADKEAGAAFKQFKDAVAKKYNSLFAPFESRESELGYFLSGGRTAVAFARLLMLFDKEYAAVKAQENKLDYNDLEHLTLALLEDERVNKEIASSFKYVYVDEYQDVNPVQEEIISSLVADCFLVGDVKQAIYGFRGSKSAFFSQKYNFFNAGDGKALRLSNNFRSSDGVLDFVNSLFSEIMREDTCGIDYAGSSVMIGGGGYPAGCGKAEIHVFGKEENGEDEISEVYSVLKDGKKSGYTREGLAVLSIVKRELGGKHFDPEKGWRDTQPGDICILTRKNKGDSAEGIVRALTDGGYPPAGAQEANICMLPEVRQMLDILSLIDNEEQDMPLVTALLSPIGGLSEDELAEIKITVKQAAPFRKCVWKYAELMRGEIAVKLGIFRGKLDKLRALAEFLDTGALIDEILENYSLESAYGAGGSEKLKNVLRLAEEGAGLPLAAFLKKVKTGGYNISAPAAASSESIKIMSMHASKGLEFPVVIISDICRTFKGADYTEMPFDEKYGFAPKCRDTEAMIVHNTVLRRLVKLRADGEELKNEMNLFYVACTRAMCNLHILAEEAKPFGEAGITDAKCYADMFDISRFGTVNETAFEEIRPRQGKTAVSAPDAELAKNIESRFMRGYAYSDSVELPVKSSASAILRMQSEEPYCAEKILFGGEGETDTAHGLAYHKFLELCDFAVTDRRGIEKELENFVVSGRMTEEESALLASERLEEILAMPVFAELKNKKLMREQEFLCRLPANEILDGVKACDKVLVQGAIDLLCLGDKVKIVDYKYSGKSDEYLVRHYTKQLKLYKKAVSVITGYSEDVIETVIVNICLCRQINIP